MKDKTERILFYSFLSINIIPLFFHKYIASLDGPQHLYISNVIVELLRSNEEISKFFKFNDVIVGNWIGHFFLSLYNLILPAWIAEKLLLVTYYLGVAFSFRYLLTSFPNKKSLLSLLVIPFSSTSLLMMGYYNFSMAIIVFMVCLGYWIRYENNSKPVNYLIFSLLLISLYLSHVFVYTLFGFTLSIFILTSFISNIGLSHNKKNFVIKKLKEILALILAAIPSILLWIIYTINAKNISGSQLKAGSDDYQLISNLLLSKILIGFHSEKEFWPRILLSILIGILLIFIIINVRTEIYSKNEKAKDSEIRFYRLAFFILSFSFLILYFVFPNSIISGNIKNRILIIFFFILITWLNLYNYNKWLINVSVLMILISLIWHRSVQYKFYHSLNREILELKEVEEYIDQNSVVFPLNFSENWIQKHFICYLGVDKPLVNLATPQCTGQFPVVWNNKIRPDLFIGSYKVEKTGFLNYGEKKKAFVDYVVVWDKSGYERKTSKNELRQNLVKLYDVIYESSSGRAMLYRLKIKQID